MKKIIFILLFFTIFNLKVSAKSKFYLEDIVPDMSVTVSDDQNFYSGTIPIIKQIGGDVVYSLNPYLQVNTDDYYNEYDYNNMLFNLTNEQLNEINLISYYGYNYKDHTDIKWYGVTQYLIWKIINPNNICLTDETGNQTKYSNEIFEIEQLILRHYIKPKINSNTFYDINSNYVLEDLNQVINDFEILSSELSANIVDNALEINTSGMGDYNIILIKKSDIDTPNKLYNLDNFSSLFKGGKVEEINFNVNIKVRSGSISITKYDSENKNNPLSTFACSLYGLYDDYNLVGTIEIDSNGYGYIDNLKKGRYYLKELKPSIGYNLDPNVYEINISNKILDVELTLYSQLIKGNLIVNKYYGSNGNYIPEEGAMFELYDGNDNFINTFETINGIIFAKLDYGNYYLIQIKGEEGYKFVDRVNITIEEEKDYIIDLYNEKIKGNLTLFKYYGEYGDYKLEDGAVFEIYDDNSNLVGTYETTDGKVDIELYNGHYNVYQTIGKEGYEFADNFDVLIENGNSYSYTAYNERIKGNLVINKYYGLKDNYQLEYDAEFELYDGQNNLIKIYNTSNGQILDMLEYGDYYLIQTKGREGYKFVDRVDINITEKKDYVINLYNDQITGNLIINKYYGNSNNYELEDRAIFEIYDINDNLINIYETINGQISTVLQYGSYYIIQTNGKEGYKFVDRVDINITEEKDYIINLYNDQIVGNLIINKYYGNSNNYELEDGTTFEIYDIYDNLLGTYETTDGQISIVLQYGSYYIIQINGKEGYKFVDRVDINITEERDYIINLYNDQIVGNLIINKYYGNSNNYELEDGTTFEIYDIYDNLLGTYETTNGQISVVLPYGKYYIIQTNGKEGYKFVDRIDIKIIEEKDYVLNLYNEQIQGNLIVNKYYGNPDNYELEDGAIFELYDINNNLIKTYETRNGIILDTLPYGDYYLIQVKGKVGYKLIDRVDIKIREEKDYILNLYNEQEIIIVEVPDTLKNNYNKYISKLLIFIGMLIIIINSLNMKKTTKCFLNH